MISKEHKQKNKSESNSVSGVSGEQLEQIEKTGSVTPKGSKYVIHCLTVAGEIEGHVQLPQGTKATRYEHIIPQLVAIEEDPVVDGMLVVLNTVGGDVEAGLALAELISGMKKPTVSLVLGGGHSIGVPLATDMGTVLCGDDAVKIGLIHKVGSLSDAINCLYDLIEQNK